MESLSSTLSQELESWIEWLRSEDRTPSTLKDYKGDVLAFYLWTEQSGGGLVTFKTVTGADARGFRDNLLSCGKETRSPLAPATVNRRMGSLAALLAHLGVNDTKNPFRKLKRVEEVKAAPKSLERNEWNAVRRAAAEYEKKDGGLALAVVSLLRHAGLRVGELAALSNADVTLGPKSGQVTIRQGKGLKSRIVPLNSDAREGLESWCESRKIICKAICAHCEEKGTVPPAWADIGKGFFLIGQRGPFSTRGIGMTTEKIGFKAGLEFPLGPHRLRHTFAKAAVDPKGFGLNRDSVPLPALQHLLGHSNISTTTIYTKFSDGDLARLLEEDNV